jgi:hypothetical protein
LFIFAAKYPPAFMKLLEVGGGFFRNLELQSIIPAIFIKYWHAKN